MAPVFVSDHPALVAWADQLWPAAERCVGRPAPAAREIAIVVGDPGAGRHGHGVLTSHGGLVTVVLRDPSEPATLAHELAHAWSNSGSAALSEGRADWLANCALAATRLDVPTYRLSDLSVMIDLVRWDNSDGATSDQNGVGYSASRYLAQVLATVLSPAELFPASGSLHWETLAPLLAAHGARGRQIQAMLDGGVETQRAALSDDDRDGLPNLAETLSGTRPDRWDTDGDGVWDGARLGPPGARPLPTDGRTRCLGVTGPLTVWWSGTSSYTTVHVGDVEIPARTVTSLALAGPAVVEARSPSPGGVWVQVVGPPSAEGCVETPDLAAYVAPGVSVDLPGLADRLGSAVRAARQQGVPVPPFSVRVTAADGALSYRGTRVSVAAAIAGEAGGAELVVATAILPTGSWSKDVPFGAQRALASALGAPDASLAPWGHADEAAAWKAAAAACPTGWTGLLGGACPQP